MPPSVGLRTKTLFASWRTLKEIKIKFGPFLVPQVQDGVLVAMFFFFCLIYIH